MSQPDMQVVALRALEEFINDDGKVDRDAVVRVGREDALAQGGKINREGHIALDNAYTGRTVNVTNQGIRHGLSEDKKTAGPSARFYFNSKMGGSIGQAVKHGVPVNGLKPTSKHVRGTYALASMGVEPDGRSYVGIVHVDLNTGNTVDFETVDITHSINTRITKEVGPALLHQSWTAPAGPELSPTSTVSIKDFLDVVNGTFQSVLSKDVLQTMNGSPESDGYYTGRVLHSERDSTRAQLSLEQQAAANGRRQAAVEEFGYTPHFYDAGFILPDGKMLNFSGEKGEHFGMRGEDHRAIAAVFDDDGGSATDKMVAFMNEGNIRMMDELPGVDLPGSTKPTAQQMKTIREHVKASQDRGFYAVDFSDANGRSQGGYEYENGPNVTRVMADIEYFYQHGEAREPSGLAQFYSEREYAAAIDQRLMALYEKHLADSNAESKPQTITSVSDRFADKINELTGDNVTGYEIKINRSGVNHIIRRHGPNGAADKSMSDPSDFARLAYVINHFNEAELVFDRNGRPMELPQYRDKNGHAAKLVRIYTDIGYNRHYVSQAVAESKSKTIWITTAFTQHKADMQALDGISPHGVTPEASVASSAVDSVRDVDRNRQEEVWNSDRDSTGAQRGDAYTDEALIAVDADMGIRSYELLISQPDMTITEFPVLESIRPDGNIEQMHIVALGRDVAMRTGGRLNKGSISNLRTATQSDSSTLRIKPLSMD